MNFDPAIMKNGVRTASADTGRFSAFCWRVGQCGPWPGPVQAHFAHPVCGRGVCVQGDWCAQAVTGVSERLLGCWQSGRLFTLSFYLFVLIEFSVWIQLLVLYSFIQRETVSPRPLLTSCILMICIPGFPAHTFLCILHLLYECIWKEQAERVFLYRWRSWGTAMRLGHWVSQWQKWD